MKKILSLLLCAATLMPLSLQAEELGKTPQMGWNSWNNFNCWINEQLIRETADAMVNEGLRDAGYVYLNLDDGWHGDRNKDGFITCDAKKFPSGMKALSDYLHERGLRFGIYSCAGRYTCAGYSGSFGHEYQDALQYARWGVDYLKYDWCNTDDINAHGAYGLMHDALKASGRKIFFSMCEWGRHNPWEWGAEVAQSWRTTGDIWAHFDETGPRSWENSVMSIVEKNQKLRKYAGPGHWNDPDMLEVGNGMSESEDRAHFTLWCMMAAPLLLGNDITKMTQATRDIILNRDVIAIDQDTLGVQGLRLKVEGDLQYWFKPLAEGDWAFCVLNTGKESVSCTIDWLSLCFTDDEVSGRSTAFDTTTYIVRNLWEKPTGRRSKTITTRKPLTVSIPSHDVALYRLTPKK